MSGIDQKNISMAVSDFIGENSMDKISPNVWEIIMKSTLRYLRSTIDLDLMSLSYFTDSTSR